MPGSVSELTVKYKSDISELQTKVATLESTMKKVDATVDKFGKNLKNKAKEGAEALNPVDNAVNKIGKQFEDLGKKILAAFAIEKIIEFGKASFDAFLEAELSAKKLQTAVSVNGGLQKDFEKLIAQSKELQKISIFSDEAIQNAQTMALQFGLTSKQVQNLIPIVTDFASATGQDLTSALDKVLAGIRGQGRGLKDYQIEVSATATKAENLRIITNQLTKSFGGQAEIVGNTAFGSVHRLKNEYNDFQEGIGKSITSIGEVTASMILWVANGFKPVDEAVETTTTRLKLNREEVKKMQQQFDSITIASLNLQLQNLIKLDAPASAIKKITDKIKQFNLQQFNSEIDGLDDKQLIQKLNDIKAAGTDFFGAKEGRLSLDEKKKLLNEEIESRKAANKLIADQNKPSDATLAQEEADRKEIFRQQQEANKQSAEDSLKVQLSNVERNKQVILGAEERSAQEKIQIEIDALNEAKKFQVDNIAVQADINAKIEALSTQLKEQKIKDATEAADAVQKQNEKAIQQAKELAIKQIELEKQKADIIRGIESDAIAGAQSLINANFEQQIEQQKESTDANIKAIDDQINANDDLRQRDMISLRDYNATHKKLLDEKTAAEKKQKDELAKIKTQQATAERLFALLQIAITVAQAVAKITAEAAILAANPLTIALAPQALAMIPLVIAAGAVQAAFVLAQPIPKFARGTKGAGQGLSMVGEEGPEFMFVPDRAKILPAEKTKRYSAMIDAMYDNKLQEHLNKFYIAPALQRQQLAFEQYQQQSFASNVANSFLLNSGGLTATEMDWIRRKGTYLRNADEIGDIIADKIIKALPNQSARRYN